MNKDNIFENNQVSITGVIVSDYSFDHAIMGEGFYQFMVEIPRLSDNVDTIPVMVSDRLVNVNKNHVGDIVAVSGQFRSFNKHENNKNTLILYVFAREMELLETDTLVVEPSNNYIHLEGYICKQPIYRKTPSEREICDMLLAVNRPYGKTDYIPCIYWGRNARYADTLVVGDRICLDGRIQSREYIKRFPIDGTDEIKEESRVCYEVSASKIEVVEEEYEERLMEG